MGMDDDCGDGELGEWRDGRSGIVFTKVWDGDGVNWCGWDVLCCW